MFLISIVFLVLGLVIHKFKCYFLIAGYNTMSKSEKEKIDINALARKMGYGFYLISIITLMCGFLSSKIPNIEILGIGATIIIVLFITVTANKTSSSNTVSSNKLALIPFLFPAIIFLAVLGLSTSKIKLGYEGNEIFIESNKISASEIVEYKLLSDVPKMNKVFGAGLGSSRKGTFEVDGYGKCIVYTNTDQEALFLKTKDDIYIVNTKNPDTVQELYNHLNEILK